MVENVTRCRKAATGKKSERTPPTQAAAIHLCCALYKYTVKRRSTLSLHHPSAEALSARADPLQLWK